jgi:hypothetical protein
LDWLKATAGSVLTSEGVSLSVLTRRPKGAVLTSVGEAGACCEGPKGRSLLFFFAVVAEEAFQFLGEFVTGGQVACALVQLRVVAFF